MAAMWLWGKEYSEQRGGSMDFWDSLNDSRKQTARRMVSDILKSRPERRSANRVDMAKQQP